MTYALKDALEMLDRLIHEHVVTGAELVRGTIALALNAHLAGVDGADDASRLLANLEGLILGDIVGFDASEMERAIRVAAALRGAPETGRSPSGLH